MYALSFSCFEIDGGSAVRLRCTNQYLLYSWRGRVQVQFGVYVCVRVCLSVTCVRVCSTCLAPDICFLKCEIFIPDVNGSLPMVPRYTEGFLRARCPYVHRSMTLIRHTVPLLRQIKFTLFHTHTHTDKHSIQYYYILKYTKTHR